MDNRKSNHLSNAVTQIDLHRKIADQQQLIANLRKQLQAEVKSANTDSLSQCFNRRGLDRAIKIENECLISGESIGGVILSMDMRYLKRINDIYGHAAGDKAIVEFSKKLINLMRDDDIVARVGGDEFMVVMRDTNPLATGSRRAELKTRLGEVKFQHDEHEISVGVRVGFAKYNSEIPIDDAIKLADEREGKIRDNLRKFDKPRYG